MTTKVKTTVTFTFTFVSESEEHAIHSLCSWFQEHTDKRVQLVKDSDTEVYTYINTEHFIGSTFQFNTPAEFIEKFCNTEGVYIPVRAMLDYGSSHPTAATMESIEVEKGE